MALVGMYLCWNSLTKNCFIVFNHILNTFNYIRTQYHFMNKTFHKCKHYNSFMKYHSIMFYNQLLQNILNLMSYNIPCRNLYYLIIVILQTQCH